MAKRDNGFSTVYMLMILTLVIGFIVGIFFVNSSEGKKLFRDEVETKASSVIDSTETAIPSPR
jgi:F0F1-type ATP synthase assembly protein I